MPARSNDNNGRPRRVFGKMVLYYRTRAGMSQEQLGARVYLSGDMIGKIEQGDRTPSDQFVDACETISELGTNGALRELREQLKDFFQQRAYPGWFADWLGKEVHAVKLRSYELAVVPGLLQTEAYARGLLSDRIGSDPGDVDEKVSARMRRHEILERGKPPELWVVIDEAVLRRPVGGANVMREQLKHLAEMARRPNIVVRVLPASLGAHDGLPGAGFVIADFDDGPSAAYQDTPVRGQIIEDADDIEILVGTWDRLAAEALPRRASLALVEEVQSTWT